MTNITIHSLATKKQYEYFIEEGPLLFVYDTARYDNIVAGKVYVLKFPRN